MRILGFAALNFSQEVGVKNQLQNVFWIRLALQLGVDHLVGKWAQRRGPFHTDQKVRPAAPRQRKEGALEDNIRRLRQCSPCGSGRSFQSTVTAKFDDRTTL